MQFTKKTSSRLTFIKLILKFFLILIIIFTAVYLLNKIDFPAPIKEIEKIISHENYIIVI